MIGNTEGRYPIAFAKTANMLSIVLSRPPDAVCSYAMWYEANLDQIQVDVESCYCRVHFGETIFCADVKMNEYLSAKGLIVALGIGIYKHGSKPRVDGT
jgi:hypothetical protein